MIVFHHFTVELQCFWNGVSINSLINRAIIITKKPVMAKQLYSILYNDTVTPPAYRLSYKLSITCVIFEPWTWWLRFHSYIKKLISWYRYIKKLISWYHYIKNWFNKAVNNFLLMFGTHQKWDSWYKNLYDINSS